MKHERQKVTSKLRAASRWRVTTPAVDHISVTTSIKSTARECVSFMPQKDWRACEGLAAKPPRGLADQERPARLRSLSDR